MIYLLFYFVITVDGKLPVKWLIAYDIGLLSYRSSEDHLSYSMISLFCYFGVIAFK